ncbi:MAG: DNA primase [Bacteroidales bacterium]|nr:DNA primase [Bacteroidales bacterium]
MIDSATVQRIIETAQILDVVQDFMTIKRRGVNYIGCCPFHNEKTPSFSVSPAKNIFKCFGCGVSGTPVSFVMKHENMTYPEALKFLAKKYGINVQEKELTEQEKSQHEDSESMKIVNSFAQSFFSNCLKNTEEGRSIALSYFKQRGFRPDTIDKFQLGYSPVNRQALTNEAIKKGYQEKFLVKTGLTIVKEDGYKFDRFAGRVMFPIHSIAGNVVAFGGRIMKTDKKIAKYVNSPESEVYHKSNVLYGIYQAKNAIVRKDKCYLVEGYCDVISMNQSGVENTVASSGTSLTPGQISVIKRFTNNLTVIYDGDWAGIKASLRGIDLILEQEINVKVVLLPEPEDPDSFALSHTPQELQDYIDQHEEDFIRFKTRILLKDCNDDPMKRAEVVTNIVGSISKISNAVTRSVYIKECSKLLDVKEDALYAETGRLIKKQHEEFIKNKFRQGVETAKSNNDKNNEVSPDQLFADEQFAMQNSQIDKSKSVPAFVENVFAEIEEREIINYLINFGNLEFESVTDVNTGEVSSVSVATFIIAELLNEELELKNLVFKQIFEDYKQNLMNNVQIDASYFLNNQDDKIRNIATELTIQKDALSNIWSRRGSSCETPEMTYKKDIPKTILTYKLKIINMAEKQTLEQLKDKNLAVDKQMEILDQIKQLNEIRKTLAQGLDRIIMA